MTRVRFGVLALAAAWIAAAAIAAEPAKTGVIKGNVTIGGRPATDVVISIEGAPQAQSKGREPSGGKQKAVIDQRDLKFIPRVLPVVAGTTVEFPNHDKTFHNVFSNSEAKKFDLGLYPSGQTRSVTFDKAGVVKILCNAHPNMEAYVVVKNHRYFSGADARGNYALSGAPLGKYRVEVWHPQFGTKTVPVELVRQGEVLTVDIDLKSK
jgi:plastocyanin